MTSCDTRKLNKSIPNVKFQCGMTEARSSSSWRVNSEHFTVFNRISNEINHFMSFEWCRTNISQQNSPTARCSNSLELWALPFRSFFISSNLLLFSFLILEFHMLLTVCELLSFYMWFYGLILPCNMRDGVTIAFRFSVLLHKCCNITVSEKKIN